MPTLSTAARDAACDAIVGLVDAGTTDASGDFLLTDTAGGGGTTLATIALNTAPAFGASSTGTATLDVSPALSASAVATGTAAGFALRDRDNTVIVSGTVATSAADVTIDNTTVASGQTVNLNAITVTVPAS